MTHYEELTIKTQRVEKLLKSQAVYNYMLSLMEVSGTMMKRTPKIQSERELYDVNRPELQGKRDYEKCRISQALLVNEKRELLGLLRDSSPIRNYVTLKVLIEYNAPVDKSIFEYRLAQAKIESPYKVASAPFRLPLQDERIRCYA